MVIIIIFENREIVMEIREKQLKISICGENVI